MEFIFQALQSAFGVVFAYNAQNDAAVGIFQAQQVLYFRFCRAFAQQNRLKIDFKAVQKIGVEFRFFAVDDAN